MGSRWGWVVVFTAAAALVAASPAASRMHAAPPCLEPSKAFLSGFRRGLRPAYTKRLGKVRAVQSRDVFFAAPTAMTRRVFFLSATIRGAGTATWVLEPSAYLTGNGHILSVEPLARKVSFFGAAISAPTVRSWGFGPQADGYAKSRTCLRV